MAGPDRIAKLEALNRLRLDGALSETEFDAEKRRVLEGADDPSPRKAMAGRWRAPVAAAAVVGTLAAAGWLGTRVVDKPIPDLVSPSRKIAARSSPTSQPSPSAVPSPAQPSSPVLDDALVFSKPRSCISGDVLARIYKKFDRAMDDGTRESVKLDAFPAALPVKATSGKDREGAWSASAELRLPADSRWHGLQISRINSSWYRPPETDSVHERTINFLDPPDQVLRTLNRLGFKTVRDPGYSELPDTYNSCGGAMSVEARNGGSALACSWGC